MFSVLSGIHLVTPWALAAALGLPVLVLAYLKQVERKRTTFSSVLILKLLPQRRLVQRKIKLPLRFFLELCALLALLLAAAWPVLDSPGKKIALIVDNSLSMSAQMRDTARGRTRFDTARAKLKERLAELGGESFTLYSSAPRLTKVGEKLTAAGVETKLPEVNVALSGDSLAASAAEVAEGGEFDRVIVVTDQQVRLGGTGSRLKTEVEAISVGDPAANLFLSGLRLERGSLDSPGTRKLVAAVGLSGAQPQSVSVRFSAVGGAQGLVFSHPVPLGTVPVSVQPERGAEAVLELGPQTASASLFRAELSLTQDSASGVIIDAVKSDNSASLAEDGSTGTQVLVVTPEPADSSKLGLSRIPGIAARVVTGEEYNRLSPDEIKRYAAVVFHMSAPPELPSVPALLILPPQGNRIFPVRGEVRTPRITSWAADHPITSYLKVPLLQPAGTVIFEVPAWAQEVINVEPGSIVAAGELRGVRAAAVGVELLPFAGAQTPVLSILTLNLFNWLTGGVELGAGLITGGFLSLDPQTGWTVSSPSAETTTVPARPNGQPTLLPVNEPGIWVEKSTDGSAAHALAVNVFHPQESATYRPAEVQLEESYGPAGRNLQELKPLWPYFIWLVLIILTIELGLRVYGIGRSDESGEAAY